MVLFPYSSP